jgi:hypothetical protein
MILKSNKKLEGYESKIYPVKEIFWMRDPGVLEAPEFTESLWKSLDENGMDWPIIMTYQSAFKTEMKANKYRHLFPKPIDVPEYYRCAVGNNRMYWACERGYTSVEAILVDTWEERHIPHRLIQQLSRK